MRKLLSLFMAAIMLVSLAPLALAREITPASTISKIEIEDADITPVAGKTPAYMGYGNMYADGSSSIISNTDGWWYCDSTMSSLDEDDTFEVGKRYSYCWMFELNSGYTVSSSTYVTINGSRSNVDEQSTDLEEGMIWSNSVYCEEQSGGEISLVEITGVTLTPPAGGKAGDYMNVETPSDLPVLTDEVLWQCLTTNKILGNDDMFVNGWYYCMKIVFEPMSGYVFADNPKVLINGSEDSIDAVNTKVNEQGYLVIWTDQLECVGSAEPTIIDKVEITDVNLNSSIGDKVGDYLDVTVPDGQHVTLVEHYWYDTTANAKLADTDTFEEGHVCQLKFVLIKDTGYSFPVSINQLIVTINGEEELVESRSMNSNTGEIIIWSIKVTIGGAPELKIIDRVELTNVTIAPPVGGKAGDYKNVTVPEGQHIMVSDEIWRNNYSHIALADDEVFEAGITYYLTFWVYPEDGYLFAKDVKIIINDKEDNFDTEYFFPNENHLILRTIPAESVEAPSVMLGDLNGDGKVNTADAVVVLKISAGMVALDEKYQAAGDCNRDGKVNTADAVLILKYAAGMITEF